MRKISTLFAITAFVFVSYLAPALSFADRAADFNAGYASESSHVVTPTGDQ